MSTEWLDLEEGWAVHKHLTTSLLEATRQLLRAPPFLALEASAHHPDMPTLRRDSVCLHSVEGMQRP